MLLHAGHEAEILSQWEWTPAIVIPLALSIILYGIGLLVLWHRAPRRGVRPWEAGAFVAGWVSLVIALISPLHPLGEELFSAHMAQHTLLMTVSAPLLVLGRPIIPWLWALPASWRRTIGHGVTRSSLHRMWRIMTTPMLAWLLQGVALWVWHLPQLYQAVLRSEAIHAVQHICFLGSALLFWWAILHRRSATMGYGPSLLYLFTAAMYSGVLGALVTVSPHLWYPVYTRTAVEWGLTPLEDQQLAGLIMWIPAGISYLIAMLVLFSAWLRESEARVRRHPLQRQTYA